MFSTDYGYCNLEGFDEVEREYETPKCCHCNQPIPQGKTYWEDIDGEPYCEDCKEEYLDACHYFNENDSGFFDDGGEWISEYDGEYYYNDNGNLEREKTRVDENEFIAETKLTMDYQSFWREHDY